MTFDRVAVVERNLDDLLDRAAAASTGLAPDAALRPESGLTARRALHLFEDQVASRQLYRTALQQTVADQS
jgi:hypothetical protein